MKTREEAFKLLTEYTKSESLITHALCVEAGMRWYARHFSEDQDYWGITGLLHDFDYERYPDPDSGGHPYKGKEILAELGYPEDIIEAIQGHAAYTGVPRESLMAKALFAVDELSGLIVASTLVRPDRSLMTLTSKSVKKKMKDKAFARGCKREDIIQGAEEIGIELGQHISNTIEALQAIAGTIGLEGSASPKQEYNP